MHTEEERKACTRRAHRSGGESVHETGTNKGRRKRAPDVHTEEGNACRRRVQTEVEEKFKSYEIFHCSQRRRKQF